MRYSAPPGTHDILPPGPKGNDRPERPWVDDVSKWHWLEGVFRELCALYNFHEIRTPVFEATELFHRAVGEGTDVVSKETYDFQDRGDRAMTLRPEGTAGVLRAFVQHRLDVERPVTKLYYLAANFRYERQQKGRYRQHHQAGVEVLGADGPDVDAEVIALARAFYTRLGLTRLTLKLNSLGTTESRARYVEALRAHAEPLLAEMSDDNQRRFRTNALRMLDSKHERDQTLLADAPRLLDYLDDASRAHFNTLQEYLTGLGIAFEVDPRLVRGFDYYTRTAFEIHSPDLGAQSALGGGGRYNQLVEELGGAPTPGIGFGLGIERALIALEASRVLVPLAPALHAFVCPLGDAGRRASVNLLGHLRAANLPADGDYTGRRLKAMLEQADRLGATYALIIGDDEVSRGVVQVRDMRSAQQTEVEVSHIAEALRGLGGLG